jgi:hypothetical protein
MVARGILLSPLLLALSSAAPAVKDVDGIMGDLPADGTGKARRGGVYDSNGLWKKKDCNLNDLAHISKCKNLWLNDKNLNATHIDSLVEQLENDTSLVSLIIQRASVLGDAGAIRIAEVIGKNTTALHSLALMDCGIGDEGAKAIAKMMNTSGVDRLQLAGNRDITLEGAESLATAHEAIGVFNTIPIGKYNRHELTVLRLQEYDVELMEATVVKSLLSGENAITHIELGEYAMDGQVMDWLGLIEEDDEKEEL